MTDRAGTSPRGPRRRRTRRDRCAAASIGVAAGCLVAMRATAQPPPRSSLAWRRGPGAGGCPGRDEVKRAVESRLGRSVFVPEDEADFVVRGEIGRAADRPGWTAAIRVWDRSGTWVGARVLHSAAPDCGPLGQAVGLALALVVESPADGVSADEPEPPREPASPPAVARSAPREAAAPVPPSAVHADSSLGVMAAAGVVPGAGIGPRIASSLESDSWRIGWGIGLWAPAEGAAGRGRVETTGWQGEMRFCPTRIEDGFVRLEPCAGIVAGRMTAKGSGFDVDRTAGRWFSQVRAGLDATAALGSGFFARAGLGAAAAIVRPRFFYLESDGSERDAWRMWPVALVGEACVGARLP